MADVATDKMVSGTVTKQLQVLDAQKALLEAQTAQACIATAAQASELFLNASLQMVLPKVCDKYLVKAPDAQKPEQPK